MTVESDGTVRQEVVVSLSQERAFWAFTDLDRIKPREHNMLEVAIAATVLQPRVGGDIYDRGVDGSVCRWGRVLAFDPPHRLSFSWDIGPGWQISADSTRTSEVDVTFAPDAEEPERTLVTLVHRHLERHGDGWEQMQAGVDAPDGWPIYLRRFQTLCANAEPA